MNTESAGWNRHRTAVGTVLPGQRFSIFSGRSVPASSGAFTLIELLVGLAVLAILVTLLTGAFSNFSQMTSASKGRIEMNKQTRTLFDRMAFDFDSAVKSGGVRMGFEKNAALAGNTPSNNDALTLLTRAKTSGTDGRMAKIGYAVGPYEDQARSMSLETMLRYVEPFDWDDDTTAISVTTDAYAQPIAPEVIRFELAFVDEGGNILAGPPSSGEAAIRNFHDNLAAVVCSIATLDADSLQKLNPAQRSAIAARLGNAVNDQAPLDEWQGVDFSDLPAPVQRGLRFHQRYFRVK